MCAGRLHCRVCLNSWPETFGGGLSHVPDAGRELEGSHVEKGNTRVTKSGEAERLASDDGPSLPGLR